MAAEALRPLAALPASSRPGQAGRGQASVCVTEHTSVHGFFVLPSFSLLAFPVAR